MITSIMLWNEPNNLSHWDFEMDRRWQGFSNCASSLLQGIGYWSLRRIPGPEGDDNTSGIA